MNKALIQKEKLFAAIRELLLEGGLENVTISKIAAKAGKSKNLIFHYFDDKETMLREFVEYFVAGKDVSYLPTLEEFFVRTDYREALIDYINALYNYHTNYDLSENRTYSEVLSLCIRDDYVNEYLTKLNYIAVKDFNQALCYFKEKGVLSPQIEIEQIAVELLVELSGLALSSAARPMPREFIETQAALRSKAMIDRIVMPTH